MFQVPPLLGLAERAPYLHEGCAASLDTLFDCGTPGQHGELDALEAGPRVDLTSYLRSL